MDISTKNNHATVEIYWRDTLKVVSKDQDGNYIGEVSFGNILLENQEFPTVYIPDLFVSSDGGFVICRKFGHLDSFILDGITFTKVNDIPQDVSE